MDQFHIVLKDYANWKMENVEILEKLKENDSMIYDRLEPVYKVLNAIYEDAVENKDLTEDMQTIFQVGLNFIHTQFEVIRIYYEKLFESNCQRFEEYSPLMGYLLFIADFRADLDEYDDNLIDFSDLNDVETVIENMIAEKDDNFQYAADRLNKAIDDIVKQLDFEYVSIVDIFVEIAENLNVELSTHKEPFVVGEEV